MVQLLSTTASIDLKTVAATALYTVPTGKTLTIIDVIPTVTAADTVLAAATASIGKSASYNEYMAATAITGLTVVGMYISAASLATALVRKTFAAGEVVAWNTTIGATATALTVSVDLIGYLK